MAWEMKHRSINHPRMPKAHVQKLHLQRPGLFKSYLPELGNLGRELVRAKKKVNKRMSLDRSLRILLRDL